MLRITFAVVTALLSERLHAQSLPEKISNNIWQAHNKSISFASTQIQQNYTEADRLGLTLDGVLNRERGGINGWEAQARWQGQVVSAPLWLQASLARSTGQTNYQGYLQTGSLLTPFGALTGNQITVAHIRVGLPLQPSVYAVQFVPFVELASQDWQRNLLQYNETYRRQSSSLGLLIQWQPANRVVIEAGHQIGLHVRTTANAPSLGFSAMLGAEQLSQTNIALIYRLAASWSLRAQVAQTRHRSDESAVVNGLQAPPSWAPQTSTALAVVWHF